MRDSSTSGAAGSPVAMVGNYRRYCSIHRERGIVHTQEDKAQAFADTMERQFWLKIQEYDEDDRDESIEVIETEKYKTKHSRYPTHNLELCEKCNPIRKSEESIRKRCISDRVLKRYTDKVIVNLKNNINAMLSIFRRDRMAHK